MFHSTNTTILGPAISMGRGWEIKLLFHLNPKAKHIAKWGYVRRTHIKDTRQNIVYLS